MKTAITKTEQKGAPKSKAYLKYEKLLQKLEALHEFRANLQTGLEKASAKINTELSVLETERKNLTRSYLIRLDELAQEIGVGKFNREWLESYMADELDMLLDFFGHQDKVLSALYEKYAGASVDDIAGDEDIKEMAGAFSKMFGFEVDPKEILEKGQQAYFEENKERIRAGFETNREQFAEEKEEKTKSAPKSAKNKKEADETKELAKDARSVYMRLIKKFHPDLETDPVLRDQKTEIVKQVTKAYQENDFFNLLKLQITYLDDNEGEAETVADDMLKRYNKLLQKQLDELNGWINDAHYASGAIIADFIDKNGKFSPQKFAARRRGFEKEIAMLQAEIASSKKKPKGWFKEQIAMIRENMQQDMMQDMMENMFKDMRF